MKRFFWIIIALIVVTGGGLFYIFKVAMGSKENMLIGKWQAVLLDNPAREAVKKGELDFNRMSIDTFAQNNTPAQNIALYHTSNLDSMRALMHRQLDTMVIMDKEQDSLELGMMTLDFTKDHTVEMGFPEGKIVCKWKIDDDVLELTQASGEGDYTSGHPAILMLTKDSLKLCYSQEGNTSTVTFKSLK